MNEIDSQNRHFQTGLKLKKVKVILEQKTNINGPWSQLLTLNTSKNGNEWCVCVCVCNVCMCVFLCVSIICVCMCVCSNQ